ncbi:MAG TPA: hypothetical protein VMZ03_14175 [Chitinophagaceae bacterium]|nr:hypothetical protein [Chitinophagaceae bacterium]
MKRIPIILLLFIVAIVLFACRGGETKADPEKETTSDRKTEERITDTKPVATPASPDSIGSEASSEILAKIDQYLVSTPVYTAQASGDITNVSVTIKNTLKDITFQKAIVEVTFLGPDGKTIKNGFYTIQNIEPDDTETVKIPNSKGSSITSHIVKVKSNQLTNGEMVLTGSHFDAGK